MSGIVGSKLNIRGSGLVGSLGTDGQHLLSAGAGKTNVFETAAGGGKVGQYLYTVLTANDQSSSTVDTWLDVTNLSVAITPAATDSVLIVEYQLCQANSDKSYWGYGRVQRDIGDAGYGDWNYNVGDNSAATTTEEITGGTSNEAYSDKHVSQTGAKLKDSTHNTTSVVTYKVQFYNATGANKINRSYNTTNSDECARTLSWISVVEILA